MIVAALVFLVVWVFFNLLAGYAPLMLAERISPGRLPAGCLRGNSSLRVRFYVGNNVRSYAFNVWAPPYTAVIFDRKFFLHAPQDVIRFVIAHELGHARYNHHIKRWLAVVSGAILLPSVRRTLLRFEQDADVYAMKITGIDSSIMKAEAG